MKQYRTLLASTVAGMLMVTGAAAVDVLAGYDSTLFNFEGFYAGIYGGGNWDGAALTPAAGAMAGVNFAVTDFVLAGVEVQGGANFAGPATYDALALGRAGVLLSDNALIYGAAGGGSINGAWGYAAGGGVELALADQITVRGEVLGTGTFGAAPTAIKANMGLLWHMN